MTEASERLIFVYGTLLHGEKNHELLDGATFRGEATTLPCFQLYDMGWHPALVRGGPIAVRGELYSVSSRVLARLDELEEHPKWFRRELIELDDGRVVQSYLLPRDQCKGGRRVRGGDWRRRRS
jgi:gamma-glutamylaminecyclotransferase